MFWTYCAVAPAGWGSEENSFVDDDHDDHNPNIPYYYDQLGDNKAAGMGNTGPASRATTFSKLYPRGIVA